MLSTIASKEKRCKGCLTMGEGTLSPHDRDHPEQRREKKSCCIFKGTLQDTIFFPPLPWMMVSMGRGSKGSLRMGEGNCLDAAEESILPGDGGKGTACLHYTSLFQKTQ